ncbi:MAG: pilin [bacterium]
MQPRLEDLQQPVMNIVYFLWSIAPLVTTFNLFRIGFEYMGSQGDPQKLAEVKHKLMNVGLSLIFIFGSWLIVTAVIAFLDIKDPNCSFTGGNAQITFQFVFPTIGGACHFNP